MRILIVEDDTGVAAALAEGLRGRGFRVIRAATAAEGAQLAEGADLMLLDMGLPDRDGLWLARHVHQNPGAVLPIIAVTARRDDASIVAALRSGVDDYVTKPYSLAVLVARIEAVIRRSRPEQVDDPDLDFGFRLDTSLRRIQGPTRSVTLTAKECDLLGALMRGRSEVVSRQSLMEEVWDVTWVGASRTLDVHIATLRSKLGTCTGPDGARIDTVRGCGYRLIPAEAAS